jgi:cytochrome c553
MKTKVILWLLGILTIGMDNAFAYNPPLEKGKEIFSLRCAACHNVNKQLTGPALAGLHERREISWIVNFVRSSQKLVKNGDKDAVALFEKFNKIPMPDHADLSDEDIHSIVEYIKAESKPVVVEKAPFSKPGTLKPNYLPLSIQKDYNFFISFLIVVALLIIVLLFAVQVNQSAYRKEKSES